jgi:antitoxin VapB
MEAIVPETRTAEPFKNGAGQAVRLPPEFRFEGTEVYATRDEQTGDALLSARPGVGAWADFFALMRSIDTPDAFMSDRPLNVPPSVGGRFDGTK